MSATCQGWPDIRYLGAESNLGKAHSVCFAEPPDVLLLDLWLPDGDGLTLAAELRDRRVPIKIIACTSRQDPVALHGYDALRLDGLLLKCGHLPGLLRAALDRVRAGGRFLSPELVEAHARMRGDPGAYYKLLSPHQQALLPLLGSGLADPDIARWAAIGASAVRAHRYRIMRALRLNRLPALMRWAVRTGFVPPSFFTNHDDPDQRS